MSGGMNLFSKNLRGEVAFSHFSPERIESNAKAELSQLEARFLTLPRLGQSTLVRLGTGLSLRYLKVDMPNFASLDSTMPHLLFLAGFETKVSPTVAIGPDISYRSSVRNDSIEPRSWDATIRLNATF